MKAIILTTAFLALLSAQSIAENKKHDHSNHNDHNSKNMHKGHHAMDGKPITISGELIGLTCFIKHGSKGKSHRSCAKDCAEKGLPIGLLSDGQIYQVSGDGHKSLVEAYKPLLKYMESKVRVKGKVFERQGLKMLVIDKIKEGS
ncbi:MAG: hypothetical protein OXB86_06035 [Bdellovibrionales bacterium]|nr:hypothetical protein [Bdellovibrionales bacterium]